MHGYIYKHWTCYFSILATFETPCKVIVCIRCNFGSALPSTLKVIVKIPQMDLCFMLHCRMTHSISKFVN